MINAWTGVSMDIVSEDDYKNFMVNFLIFKKKKDFSPICRIITTVNVKKVIVWLFGRRYILKTLALRRTDKQGSSSRLKVCNFSDVVRNPVLTELEDSELTLGCVLLLILI